MSILDHRLNAVLSLVPRGSILLDVGTDHCKLPAEGLLSGRLAAAFAADIKKGPLAAAEKQLTALGLAGKIPLYLSNGLESIPPEVLSAVTAVTVAGMGGEVIELIMNNAPAEPPLWVLQPMSAIYELLDGLAAKGYQIENAALTQDGEKFYRAFGVRKGGEPYPPDYFGMHRGDPLYIPYLLKEEKRMETALAGLSAARNPDRKRIAETEQMLESIRKAMA